MLKEHKELIDFIENYMVYPITIYSNCSIDYIKEEFTGIQVQVSKGVDNYHVENLRKSIKEEYSEIISFIYTIKEKSLFVIYLKPIEEIRSKKISTIKRKINGI